MFEKLMRAIKTSERAYSSKCRTCAERQVHALKSVDNQKRAKVREAISTRWPFLRAMDVRREGRREGGGRGIRIRERKRSRRRAETR
jgi:hypothetical protein